MDLPDRFETWIFFWPEKKCFDTFRRVSPFSNPFLWAQSSGFEPNVRNLVQKSNFGHTIPARYSALQKNGKNQKTVLPASFSWFDSFQHTNNCKLYADQVSRYLIIKKCDFCPLYNFWPSPVKLDQWFLNGCFGYFWAKKTMWMGFL